MFNILKSSNSKKHDDESSSSDLSSENKSFASGDKESKLSITSLNGWFGSKHALKNINIEFKKNRVTALIGPSGCGKTTLLRCINRMHEMTPNASVKGKILLDDIDIYDKSSDPVIIKRRMGMVF